MLEQKQQAVDVLSQWVNFVNAGDANGVMTLYTQEAILLPTFSPKILATTEEIKAYFTMLASRPGARVELDESSVVTTPTSEESFSAVGNYTFYFEEEGEPVAYPSRFTFVINPSSSQPISHQHSSELPAG